jgi:hypothetical protein
MNLNFDSFFEGDKTGDKDCGKASVQFTSCSESNIINFICKMGYLKEEVNGTLTSL